MCSLRITGIRRRFLSYCGICQPYRRSNLRCSCDKRIRKEPPPWQMIPTYRSPDLSTFMYAFSVAVPSAEKSSELGLLRPASTRARSAVTKARSTYRYVRSKAAPKIRITLRQRTHPNSGKLPCCGGDAMLLSLRPAARTYSLTSRSLLSDRVASLVTRFSCSSASGRIAIPSEAMRHAESRGRNATPFRANTNSDASSAVMT